MPVCLHYDFVGKRSRRRNGEKPVTAGLALPPFDWLGAVATDNGAGAATGAAVRVYSMNATRWACDSDRCSYWRCRRRVS